MENLNKLKQALVDYNTTLVASSLTAVITTGTDIPADANVIQAVTDNDTTKWLNLPAIAAGKQISIRNTAAANVLLLKPQTGEYMLGTANGTYSIPAATQVTVVACTKQGTSTLTWAII